MIAHLELSSVEVIGIIVEELVRRLHTSLSALLHNLTCSGWTCQFLNLE